MLLCSSLKHPFPLLPHAVTKIYKSPPPGPNGSPKNHYIRGKQTPPLGRFWFTRRQVIQESPKNKMVKTRGQSRNLEDHGDLVVWEVLLPVEGHSVRGGVKAVFSRLVNSIP